MAKAAKKAAKPKAPAAASAPRSKSQVLGTIAESTGVSKKDVAAVFDCLGAMIKADLGKKGTGLFTVPGLMKISVTRKPATKAREGVNPFTGEKMMFKAKPARNVVKVRPLKALKDMVA
ncbi:MAG: HU family DNA-binding protein [Candidatus Methylomirabilis sp.]|nr:HU family DNA-binding protein [Deltaproteobacteria bacterium]